MLCRALTRFIAQFFISCWVFVFPTYVARCPTSAAATAIQIYLMKAQQIARTSASAAFPITLSVLTRHRHAG
jgi:hypothetical protein